MLPEASAARQQRLNHLIWVWRFREDGPASDVRQRLASNGLGIILKTHDGSNWMREFDKSADAIGGGADVQRLARYFEDAGVPFHAWAVAKGHDPIREAHMCAEVLSSGARSITLDLEPPEGGHYWQGKDEDAVAFGRELRRLQPNAWIGVAPDPRPWQLEAVPMRQFAAFADEIAPQTYWDMFSSPANYRLLRQRGFEVGDRMTPELVLEMSKSALGGYGLPISPIGYGDASSDDWQRFVTRAFELQMDTVSVWRFGTAQPDVMPMLQNMKPKQPKAPVSIFKNDVFTSTDTGGITKRRSTRQAAASSSRPTDGQ
jgi:hypothetical protein